jgi:glycosyltransferase involved in cell wall biosynthesis
MEKIKVLFIASDCNPEWHSLPALIAEYYAAVAKHVDVTLVTQIRNKAQLEPWLPKEAKVHYIDSEKIARPLYRFTRFVTKDPDKAMTLQVALRYPSYLYFEYCVWRTFKKALLDGEYDIVHRGSPMSPTLPSTIAKRCPVPFVIGPVLGGLPWPDVFKHEMRREREWMNYFRRLHHLMPYYRSTYRHAAAILAGYKHTVDDIPQKNAERIIEFSEGGIHPEDFPPESDKNTSSDSPATILFVGRLVPFKQPEILIRCVERSATLQKHKTIIVGGGPELSRLEKLVVELGLSHCVELTGPLPTSDVRRLMEEATVFAFPSIREQGGGVITMASMSFTPSVVVDYGGPSFRVPDKCGIKVPVGTQDEIVEHFIGALEKLVNNKHLAKALGINARAFTEKYYSWSWKALSTVAIYRWVLGLEKNKPEFWENKDTLIESLADVELEA